jgi:hypothetical protein
MALREPLLETYRYGTYISYQQQGSLITKIETYKEEDNTN